MPETELVIQYQNFELMIGESDQQIIVDIQQPEQATVLTVAEQGPPGAASLTWTTSNW